MKKIYPSKILPSVIFLLRSIDALAKKQIAKANFSLTENAVDDLIPSSAEFGKTGLRFSFIQFTPPEFRSL